MKKKVIALILSVMSVLSIFTATTVSALAWEHPDSALKATLYSDQYKSYSDCKSDKYMYYEGKNTSAKQRVYFQMQYSSNKSSWTDDKYLLASPGAEVGKSKSSTKTSKVYWRLCLDAYGIVTGATAYGWTW